MGLAFCRVTDDDQPGRVAAEGEGGLLAPSSLPQPPPSLLAREEKLGGVTTLGDAAAAAGDDHHSDPFLTPRPFKDQI